MKKFVDAQRMAKQNPKTFGAPSKEELNEVKEGSLVKVCFDNERFWCNISEVNGDKITAVVDNNLMGDFGFNCEDTVKFEKRHIYDIW